MKLLPCRILLLQYCTEGKYKPKSQTVVAEFRLSHLGEIFADFFPMGLKLQRICLRSMPL